MFSVINFAFFFCQFNKPIYASKPLGACCMRFYSFSNILILRFVGYLPFFLWSLLICSLLGTLALHFFSLPPSLIHPKIFIYYFLMYPFLTIFENVHPATKSSLLLFHHLFHLCYSYSVTTVTNSVIGLVMIT